MNPAIKWIDAVRGTDSIREVARKSGIPQPTLARQVNGGQLTFESVRDISRAYGRSVLADLVSLGLLNKADVGLDGTQRALAVATDEELVSEVGRRLDVTPQSTLWDAPVSTAVDSAENVLRLVQDEKTEADDLAVASEYSVDRGEDGEYDA